MKRIWIDGTPVIVCENPADSYVLNVTDLYIGKDYSKLDPEIRELLTVINILMCKYISEED